MELWELATRERIRDCIARWDVSGDAGRCDELLSVLAPDVEYKAGDGCVVHGRDAVVAHLTGSSQVPGAHGPYLPSGERGSIRHFTATTLIEIDSDVTAHVQSHYAVLSSFGLDHWGRYLDEFAFINGEWLIKQRTATLDGVEPNSWVNGLTGEATEAAGWVALLT